MSDRVYIIEDENGKVATNKPAPTALAAWLNVITDLQQRGTRSPKGVIYMIIRDLGYTCRKVSDTPDNYYGYEDEEEGEEKP